MSLIANFDDIRSLAPCLVAGEAIRDGLQSRLVKVNQNRNIVDFPLDKIAAIEATSVSEREFELLGNLSRNSRLHVRDDGLVVAPSG
jgi:hypothetical protein